MEKTPLSAVLVGCGGITNTWMKAIEKQEGLALVGIVDLIPANMDAFAEKHGLGDIARSTDLDALLAELKPDLVFNCTVPPAHRPVTLTALKHGCHILGEKPLADNMADAREMVVAAEAAGRIFAVIQNRRYQAQIRSLRSFLDSGAIGRVTTVNVDFYLGAHFGGFRDRMEHVLLLDMAIHSFDQARLVSGASPRSVYCHEWNPAGSWYDHDASAHCIFEMSDGIVLNYRGSWCCEGLNTTWECDWRIIGEKGCVKWNGGSEFEAQAVDETGTFISKMVDLEVECSPSFYGDAHEGNLREFLECVRLGKTPETVGADNIRSLAMVFAAIESAEAGRKVIIPEC